MMAAPLVTWGMMQRSAASPKVGYRIESTPRPLPSPATVTTNAAPASVGAKVSGVEPRQFLLWVVMVWLTGAVVCWVRLAGGWVAAARMRSMLVRRAPPEWQEILRKLGARIGLS